MKDGMLEFSDWPMFDLLMTDKELCREVIEIILDESIADIEYIVTEDDVRPTLTNHGVRLDAFVKTKNEIYDIEMQKPNEKISDGECDTTRERWIR